MSTVNTSDTFAIGKENSILMLPLRVETRFMRIANDPAFGGLVLLNNGVTSLFEDLNAGIIQVALEEGEEAGSLKGKLEERQEAFMHQLYEVDRLNQASNRELLAQRESQAKLVPAIQKEATALVKKLNGNASTISRTQTRVSYRIGFFEKKLKSRLESDIRDEAERTRWTSGRKSKTDTAISELLKLFKVLRGQELSVKEMLHLQRSMIAHLDTINYYLKSKANIYNPEFEGIHHFGDRIAAEGKRFRDSLKKRLEAYRAPLYMAKRVLKIKDLYGYCKKSPEIVQAAAPESWKEYQVHQGTVDLLERLNDRKQAEAKKLQELLKDSDAKSRDLKADLQSRIMEELKGRYKKVREGMKAVREVAAKPPKMVAQKGAFSKETEKLDIEGQLQTTNFATVLEKSDANQVATWLREMESANSRLLTGLAGEEPLDEKTIKTLEQSEEILAKGQKKLEKMNLLAPRAQGLLEDFSRLTGTIGGPLGAMAMAIPTNTGLIGVVPHYPPHQHFPPLNTQINPSFVAAADPNDPNTYTFLNTSYSTPFSIGNSTWSFGDGQIQSLHGKANAAHTYAGPGTYKVNLSIQAGGLPSRETHQYITIVDTNDGGGGNTSGPTEPDAIYELWIRAYPDDIAVETHEPALTHREEEAGRAFWNTVWKYERKEDVELPAWRSLVRQYGPQRAAWIVKALTPTNLSKRPERALDNQGGGHGHIGGLGPDDGRLANSEEGKQLWKDLAEAKGDHEQEQKIWEAFSEKMPPEEAMETAFFSLEEQIKEKSLLRELPTEKELLEKEKSVDDLKQLEDTVSLSELPDQKDVVLPKGPLGTQSGSNPNHSVRIYDQNPAFPSLTTTDKKWNKAPEIRVLPRKLLYAAYRHNGLAPYLKFGNVIPDPLPAGIDPQNNSTFSWDANGNLVVAGGVKWMVDFAEAEAVGMAVRIPISSDEADPTHADAGFERIVVVGARDQDDASQSKTTLESLLDNHHYTGQGLSLLPQGTPTNNTGTSDSGFKVDGTTVEESYRTEIVNGQTAYSSASLGIRQPLRKTDGDTLAEKLSIDPKVVRQLDGANGSEIRDSRAMNQALWAGTFGQFLEDVFYSNDPRFQPLFSLETIDQLRTFFIDHVRGRGHLPVLRVKNQPYGILPMTNFKRHEGRLTADVGNTFNEKLYDVLVHRFWKGFRQEKIWADKTINKHVHKSFASDGQGGYDVPRSGKWANLISSHIRNVDDAVTGSNPLLATQKRFLNMLALLPHSDDVFLRYGVGIEAKGTQFSTVIPSSPLPDGSYIDYNVLSGRMEQFYENFMDLHDYQNLYQYQRIDPGVVPGSNGVVSHSDLHGDNCHWGYRDWYEMAMGSQASKLIFATEESQLKHLIDELPAKRDRSLANIPQKQHNYIHHLIRQSFAEMSTESQAGQEPSHSLFYLLAQKSMLQSYWDSGMRIWEKYTLSDKLYKNHFEGLIYDSNNNAIGGGAWRGADGHSDYLTLFADQNTNGQLTSEMAEEILFTAWRICLHFGWDLNDLWTHPQTLGPALTGVYNPYGLNELYAKTFIRLYLIDWDAVNTSLVLNVGRGYGVSQPYNFPAADQAKMTGQNPKKFLRGILSRERYKSFVVDQAIQGQFRIDLDFDAQNVTNTGNPNFNPLSNFLDHATFADKIYFLNLDKTFPAKADNRAMHEFLSDNLRNPYNAQAFSVAPEMQRLRETRDALSFLANRSTDQLQRALLEHLDLCSYRLDAWILGLADRRLDELKSNPAFATFLGAYGWVEQLRPGGIRTDETGTPIAHNIDEMGVSAVAIDPDNQGFVHAPSVNHAVTAAILRSAYQQTEAEIFQVNLSSERVRKAKDYIDGIRGGVDLPVLLGYEFERCLHDIDPALNQYLPAIRQAFPLVANQLESASDNGNAAIEQLAARNLVDGLALTQAVEAAKEAGHMNYPFGITSLPSPNANVSDQVNRALARIEDSLDGLGDLALAEGVYQAAMGNFERSGSMMKALSNGTSLPEPEIIDTPRRYKPVGLRAGAILQTENVGSPWLGVPMTPRSNAEPVLNHWIGVQLGRADEVEIHYTYFYLNTDDEKTRFSGTFWLQELELQPLDLLPMIAGLGQGGASELHRRIEMYLRSSGGHLQVMDLSINFSAKGELAPAHVKSLSEWAPLARELGRLVLDGKAMVAADLELSSFLPNAQQGSTIGGEDIAEMEGRVSQLFNRLQIEAGQLDVLLAQPVFDHYQVRETLNRLSRYGMPEVLPYRFMVAGPAEEADLRTLSAAAQGILQKKMKGFQKEWSTLQSGASSFETVEKMDLLTKAAQAILGPQFRLLPRFRVYNGADLHAAVQNSPTILPTNDFLAVDAWLHGIGKVRDRMACLENIVLLQELHDRDLSLTPVQLPLVANDQWLALPFDPATVDLTQEKLSLCLSLPGGFEPATKVYAGLLVDDWIEQVPEKEQDTAIAFHYDQPNAKAAQSILLGVHSDHSSGNWDYEELLKIVESTAEMVRLRAVEPDQLMADGSDAFSLMFPGLVGRIDDGSGDLAMDFGKNLEEVTYQPTPAGGGSTSPNSGVTATPHTSTSTPLDTRPTTKEPVLNPLETSPVRS